LWISIINTLIFTMADIAKKTLLSKVGLLLIPGSFVRATRRNMDDWNIRTNVARNCGYTIANLGERARSTVYYAGAYCLIDCLIDKIV